MIGEGLGRAVERSVLCGSPCCCSGRWRSPRCSGSSPPVSGFEGSSVEVFVNLVVVLTAGFAFVYLVYAMLRPERF